MNQEFSFSMKEMNTLLYSLSSSQEMIDDEIKNYNKDEIDDEFYNDLIELKSQLDNLYEKIES